MTGSAFSEWPATLDMAALTRSGWRPFPFEEFVVKIHSRCDLACTYCYMYTLADQGWRRQPAAMPSAVMDVVARRIGEHAAAHSLRRARVILHGGEPLLAGAERLRYLTGRLRDAIPAEVALSLQVQTNGMHLTEVNLALLADLGIQVGVSLDGAAADHDRHRIRPNGRGSYAEVERGLSRLGSASFRHLFRGLLCTVDLASDPVRTYDELRRFDPPAIDFLLPHGNWENPAPGLLPGSGTSPYADWLVPVFDSWYRAPVQPVRVRLFEQIMQALLAGRAEVEGLGLQPARIVVIETDGSIEQSDFLKSAYSGAAGTGLNVRDDPLDAALRMRGVAARQIGEAALCEQCRGCQIRQVCGGGHYAHRYRPGAGFRNPSVYCADLTKLITYIREQMIADVAKLRATC